MRNTIYSNIKNFPHNNGEPSLFQTKMEELDEEMFKKTLGPILAVLVNQLVLLNDRLPAVIESTFDAITPPEISIHNYIDRIIKYTPCSKECYIAGIIYIDRIIQSRGFVVNSFNVHRVLITSIMISAKLIDDTTYNNKYYSHVGGIGIAELNRLECQFLILLDYNLNISCGVFEKYLKRLDPQILEHHRASTNVRQRDGEIPNEGEAPTYDSNIAVRNLTARQLRRSKSFNTSHLEEGKIEELRPFRHRRQRSSSFNIQYIEVIAEA